MLDKAEIEHLDSLQLRQLRVLTDPLKVRLLNELQKPKTVSEIADILGLERNSLYYHIRILVRLGMVEEVEVRKVKNLSESVYKAVWEHNFSHDVNPESAPMEDYYQAIDTIMREISRDCHHSTASGKKPVATVARRVLRIKPEKFKETKSRLMEMEKKFMEGVIGLDDDDDEGIEYSVNITQFEM